MSPSGVPVGSPDDQRKMVRKMSSDVASRMEWWLVHLKLIPFCFVNIIACTSMAVSACLHLRRGTVLFSLDVLFSPQFFVCKISVKDSSSTCPFNII